MHMCGCTLHVHRCTCTCAAVRAMPKMANAERSADRGREKLAYIFISFLTFLNVLNIFWRGDGNPFTDVSVEAAYGRETPRTTIPHAVTLKTFCLSVFFCFLLRLRETSQASLNTFPSTLTSTLSCLLHLCLLLFSRTTDTDRHWGETGVRLPRPLAPPPALILKTMPEGSTSEGRLKIGNWKSYRCSEWRLN